MSTEQVVILIVFLILVALNQTFLAIGIMTRKRNTHDMNQKTWERIEGRRK